MSLESTVQEFTVATEQLLQAVDLRKADLDSATNSAQVSAEYASASMSTATTQAGIATTKAAEAGSSAATATTQAAIAVTKASEANISAASAANSAALAAAINLTALHPSDINVTVQAHSDNLNSWSNISPSAKQDTLISTVNIKSINGSSILGTGDLILSGLPSQTGNAGKYLTTDGSNPSWVTLNVDQTIAKLCLMGT